MPVPLPVSVFINCPFDDAYQPLFRAMVFTVLRCGFRSRCALEVTDGAEVRLEKICRIIADSPLGIHDLSRTELNDRGLPRFNMPFELGLFLGAKRYGDKKQRAKRALVLDTEPHRYQAFLSDIGGQDITAYARERDRLIAGVRDFLNTPRIQNEPLPAAAAIAAEFDTFLGDLPDLCARTGHQPADLTYVDYQWFVSAWLDRPSAA